MFCYEIGVYVSPLYEIGYPLQKGIVWDRAGLYTLLQQTFLKLIFQGHHDLVIMAFKNSKSIKIC